MSSEDEEEVDELYLSDESDDDDEFDLCEDVMIKDHETEVKEDIRGSSINS